MLVLMHDGDPYGHLSIAGEAITVETLASLVGISERICRELLEELERKKVFSRLKNGVIYSRRMVRDHQFRLSKVNAGRLGGYAKHKSNNSGRTSGKKLAEPLADGLAKPLAKSRSSYSSSTSYTNNKDKGEDSGRSLAGANITELAEMLRSDDQFIYQAARANQRTGHTPSRDWVLSELDRFAARLIATGELDKDAKDFRTHFINWLSKQEPPSNKQNANPFDVAY